MTANTVERLCLVTPNSGDVKVKVNPMQTSVKLVPILTSVKVMLQHTLTNVMVMVQPTMTTLRSCYTKSYERKCDGTPNSDQYKGHYSPHLNECKRSCDNQL